MKAVIKILPYLFITVYLIVAFGFTSGERKNVICTDIQIIIRDSLNRKFYSENDIKQVINNSGIRLEGCPVTSINTRDMEELFNGMPYLSKVDIYTTMHGALTVKIKQREPLVRIFTGESRSYYLDKEGFIMPESRKYTPFVMIANGYFSAGDEINKVLNIHDIEDKQKYKEWFDVLELTKRIQNDPFWKSQIVQIYCNRKGILEIIPRVGSHLIILGDLTELDAKFEKLKTLYIKGFSAEGWNNYEQIDVRYKNQVVCTKR